ncbi:Phytanoyl-CoA dioxygenase [Chthoniobacter flavus Ellin428]|uniref:Phytanoyl-CoA dioxygenase n=1 Tax=Chthoniobacter flavus Ellin428 TaxID=497964 RepID=B4CW21_9BACT|nr:phytanoyl-CoA dioxygenase family protein [Chthoniobacter flavus]EDY21613.1 Phytanoyl-CoA dioxygenase [Chthoniobacter flavus Ellin428]TCO95552.1 ectoine hydroxylase [Chthoniobacter flavus]
MRLTAEQIASFHEDGFLVLQDWFTPDEVDLLRTETYHEFGNDQPGRILEKNGAVRTVFAAHKSNDVFSRLTRLQKMAEPAAQLLGDEVYVHQFKINAKLGLDGDQWEWHQDYLYWLKEDAMPTPNVLSAVVFLNTVDDFNGPLLLIPGSQKMGTIDLDVEKKYQQLDVAESWKPTLTADLKYKISKRTLIRALENSRIVAAKGTPGFVVFFHGNTLHASAGNLSPVDRLSVFISYNTVANALQPIANPRPTFISERDFTPIAALPDDALLAPRNGHSSPQREQLASLAG